MSVILLILKIIGILLLILLGILLLLLAGLLIPVRYTVSGEAQESVKLDVRVTWLFHLISWRGVYREREFTSCLRIFGIRKRQKRPAEDSREELWQEDEVSEDTSETETPGGESRTLRKKVPEDRGKTDSDASGASQKRRESHGEEAQAPGEHRKTGGMPDTLEEYRDTDTDEPDALPDRDGTGMSAARGIFSRIRHELRRFKEKFRQIKNAVAEIPKRFRGIKEIIWDEANKIAVVAVFTEVRYLLGHFKFRKVNTELEFCLGDPALTGQALGALCVIPFLYRYNCNVYPDFESDDLYVRGTFDLKGRARAVHIALSFVRLWKKKEFRSVTKRLLNRS